MEIIKFKFEILVVDYTYNYPGMNIMANGGLNLTFSTF